MAINRTNIGRQMVGDLGGFVGQDVSKQFMKKPRKLYAEGETVEVESEETITKTFPNGKTWTWNPSIESEPDPETGRTRKFKRGTGKMIGSEAGMTEQLTGLGGINLFGQATEGKAQTEETGKAPPTTVADKEKINPETSADAEELEEQRDQLFNPLEHSWLSANKLLADYTWSKLDPLAKAALPLGMGKFLDSDRNRTLYENLGKKPPPHVRDYSSVVYNDPRYPVTRGQMVPDPRDKRFGLDKDIITDNLKSVLALRTTMPGTEDYRNIMKEDIPKDAEDFTDKEIFDIYAAGQAEMHPAGGDRVYKEALLKQQKDKETKEKKDREEKNKRRTEFISLLPENLREAALKRSKEIERNLLNAVDPTAGKLNPDGTSTYPTGTGGGGGGGGGAGGGGGGGDGGYSHDYSPYHTDLQRAETEAAHAFNYPTGEVSQPDLQYDWDMATFDLDDADMGLTPAASGGPIPFAQGGGLSSLADKNLAPGSFVLSADTISGIGDGSSESGLRRLNTELGFPITPNGVEGRAYGGTISGTVRGPGSGLDDLNQTTIAGKQAAALANQEVVVSPGSVTRLAQMLFPDKNMSTQEALKSGQEALYNFQTNVRKQKADSSKGGKQPGPLKTGKGGLRDLMMAG